MKIIETTGCTAFDLTINGKSTLDISPEEMDKHIDYILSKIKEGLNEHSIDLASVIRIFSYDSWENDGIVCDQCGDSVSTTTWEI